MQGLSEAHLHTIREWAGRLDFVSAVYGFGSRARNEASDESDLDLAVVTPHQRHSKGLVTVIPLSEEEKTELVSLLELPFTVDIQVTHPEAGDRRVWPAVLDHGFLVYHSGSK